LQETGSLDRLWEAADHTHRAAVISAVEELVQSQESKLHTHTFVYQVDISNILCDYQFVFSVLEELCVSRHA